MNRLYLYRGTPPRGRRPMRSGHVVVVTALIFSFPFLARLWFDPATVVALTAAVATSVTVLVTSSR